MVQGRPAVQGRGIDHWKVELLFGGPQLVKEVKGLADHPVRPGPWTVNLVDHHDGLETLSQGLSGHKAGLGHWALDGIDQQQNAVHHGQDALYLTTKVCVPRSVHDVDVGVLIGHRTVLGQNGDAALFLKIVGIHDPLGNGLIGSEGSGLRQELVDQRGFTVVNVGNDGDVAQLAHRDSLVKKWLRDKARGP